MNVESVTWAALEDLCRDNVVMSRWCYRSELYVFQAVGELTEHGIPEWFEVGPVDPQRWELVRLVQHKTLVWGIYERAEDQP